MALGYDVFAFGTKKIRPFLIVIPPFLFGHFCTGTGTTGSVMTMAGGNNVTEVTKH
jgi:hypothetical protein